MADRTAAAQGVDTDLVRSIIQAESNYEPQAISRAGAMGLMQVMPETAVYYGVRCSEDLLLPETNLRVGTRHLRRLIDRYGKIAPAVMAYNAGELALEQSGGFVTYPETQRYTHRVLTDYLSRKGVSAYSEAGEELIGMRLTPQMASATGGWSGGEPPARIDLPAPALTGQRPQLKAAAQAELASRTGRLSPRLANTALAREKPRPRVSAPTYRVSR